MAKYLGVLDDSEQLVHQEIQYHCVDGKVYISALDTKPIALPSSTDTDGWVPELNSLLPFIRNGKNCIGYCKESYGYFCITCKEPQSLVGTKQECVDKIKKDSGLVPPKNLLKVLDRYISLKILN